ncbi:hypothetical protein DM02DRAFT_652168 [Periconia macrospinosa]|uniref:Uncharacterized protein n=1 Tax=Periconia macrospinosa TaxID=97972 RepID=A0A2V1E3C2_9PLEO|nr:hypothetical protein DM02DRAFT_652168 [Periconia macrospinosa]
MSGGLERPPDTVVPTTTLKRKRFSDEDQVELDKLDGLFKRMKKSIPEAPYILSTPSLYPYRYHSQHEAQAWMMGRLFRPDEEHLQYRTYLFREPYQDCFTLQLGEDVEPEPPRPSSQATTTSSSSQAPKKKISLSAYKSKQATGVITPGSKKVSPNLPPTKPSTAQINGAKPPPEKKPPPNVQNPDAARKNNHFVPNLALPEKPKQPPQKEQLSAPPARPQKPESAEAKTALDKSDPSNSTPHGLPPLLSPVDPPLSNPYGLPPILSPTLPASVTEALKKLDTKRDRADSNTSTSSSDPKSQLLNVPEPDSKQNSEAKNVVRERSVSMSRKSPAKSPKPNPPSQVENVQTLVVKLKYTKKTRDTIKQILRLPPKQHRQQSAVEQKQREEMPKERSTHAQKKPVEAIPTKSKPVPKLAGTRRAESSSDAVASKVPAVAPSKVAQKRPRPDDDGPQPTASKRPRASSIQEAPHTPKEHVTPSTAPPTKLSSQKSSQSAQVTPRKDKGINMLRTASAESYDSTPGKANAPAASKHLEVKAASLAPLNNKKQADISLWQHASMKWNQKGRSLKHDSQKLERENPGKKEDQKRAAVIGLECILTYMTAFYMQDHVLQLRGRPAEVEGTWKTLLPLCASYARLTKDFKHLDGLRSYLASVVAANICTLLAPRAPNPKAHDSPHELPHADLAKQHSQVLENFAMMSDHYNQMQHYTLNARIALSMDDIQKLYPKTWSGAETHAKPSRAPEKVNGLKLSGSYFLPIANDTTPIQAVRFGIKLVHEYCEKERLDHTIRIDLDRPA